MKETKIKLSVAQREVVELLRCGWELAYTHGIWSKRSWIQKDGIGNGGLTRSISCATFNKLLKLEIIKTTKESYPTNRYGLTELGKTI